LDIYSISHTRTVGRGHAFSSPMGIAEIIPTYYVPTFLRTDVCILSSPLGTPHTECDTLYAECLKSQMVGRASSALFGKWTQGQTPRVSSRRTLTIEQGM
jgi:hypothetical protein